jgi:hypothetical protein
VLFSRFQAVNGQLDRQVTTNVKLAQSSGSFKIGRNPFNNSLRLNGRLDQVCVYARALGTNELASLATGSGKSQSWILEPAGNWSQFRDGASVENRTHNIFNEITAINGEANAVAHDAAGYMGRFPSGRDGSPQPSVFLATWDAWNRMTRLSTTGGITIALYTYDGEPPSS